MQANGPQIERIKGRCGRGLRSASASVLLIVYTIRRNHRFFPVGSRDHRQFAFNHCAYPRSDSQAEFAVDTESLSVLTVIFHGWLWVKPVPECLHSGFYWRKDDTGDGDNWSYKPCKAPVKSSPPTNQHPAFYRPDALPVAQPAVSKQ